MTDDIREGEEVWTSPRIIASEEDAWKLLAALPHARFQLPALQSPVVFQGWPAPNIHILAEPKATLTPPMMKALLEYQNAIYRSYAVSAYGVANIARLTEEEKKRLEIRVTIREGGTNIDFNATDVAKSLVSELMAKMDPTQVALLSATAMVLIFGYFSIRLYLKHREKTQETALESASEKGEREHVEQIAKIIKSLAEKEPKVILINGEADKAKDALIEAIEEVGDTEVQGARVTRDSAIEMTERSRRKSSEVRIDGVFKILLVDPSAQDGFKVKVERVSDKKTFWASIQDILAFKDQRAILKTAEWDKKPVKLNINATVLGDDIHKATIIDAEIVPAAGGEALHVVGESSE